MTRVAPLWVLSVLGMHGRQGPRATLPTWLVILLNTEELEVEKERKALGKVVWIAERGGVSSFAYLIG